MNDWKSSVFSPNDGCNWSSRDVIVCEGSSCLSTTHTHAHDLVALFRLSFISVLLVHVSCAVSKRINCLTVTHPFLTLGQKFQLLLFIVYLVPSKWILFIQQLFFFCVVRTKYLLKNLLVPVCCQISATR